MNKAIKSLNPLVLYNKIKHKILLVSWTLTSLFKILNWDDCWIYFTSAGACLPLMTWYYEIHLIILFLPFDYREVSSNSFYLKPEKRFWCLRHKKDCFVFGTMYNSSTAESIGKSRRIAFTLDIASFEFWIWRGTFL